LRRCSSICCNDEEDEDADNEYNDFADRDEVDMFVDG
jgi:hypothetical protein